MSIDVYSLNAHLFQGRERPAEVRPPTIKTEFVTPSLRTRKRILHRPTYAVTAYVKHRRGDGSRFQIAARFLCGSSSADVIPVAERPVDMDACPRCEKAFSTDPETWSVYCYFDADGAPLYVGQTVDMPSRHRTHGYDARSSAWFPEMAHLSILSTHDTRRAALDAEREAIHALSPRHNVVHSHLRVIA